MFGDLKTDAGRNRCVPVHPIIRDLIVRRYDEAKAMGSEYLLKRIVGHSIPDITENVYTYREFEELIEAMNCIKE